MLWLIVWILALLIFLVVPILCDDRKRKFWLSCLGLCCSMSSRGRQTSPGDTSGGTLGQTDGPEVFRYVLSTKQEDEIREMFILEKVNSYSMTLDESQFQRKRGDSVSNLSKSYNANNQQSFIEEIPKDQLNFNKSSSCSSVDEKEFMTTQSNEANEETRNAEKDVHELEISLSTSSSSSNAKDIEAPSTVTSEKIDNKSVDLVKNKDRTETAATVSVDDKDIESGDVDEDDEFNMVDVDIDEFMGESVGFVYLPCAGQRRPDIVHNSGNNSGLAFDNVHRNVRNGCAICLCTFEVNEHVAWSGNSKCTHVFHHRCIVDWLIAAGKKNLKRLRRLESRTTGLVNYATEPVASITGCPMLCPCCRQSFVDRSESSTVVELKCSNASTSQSSHDQSDTEEMAVLPETTLPSAEEAV